LSQIRTEILLLVSSKEVETYSKACRIGTSLFSLASRVWAMFEALLFVTTHWNV